LNIYPDSSDLINLCHEKGPLNLPDLAAKLTAGSHRIAISMQTLIELAAPLGNNRTLEVRRDLNLLEELPLIFINEGRIYDMELREAVEAFNQGREYHFAAIAPFAQRLCEAIDMHNLPLYIVENGRRIPTTMLVNFRMWEAIDYVWKHEPRSFDVQRRRAKEWAWLLESDRSMTDPPKLREHFPTMIQRALATHRILAPSLGTEPFARWVYELPSRCPGIRLQYETQHRLRRDRHTRPRASDLIDLTRIVAAPYVDFFVTDSAMMTYCRQAAAEMGRPYGQLLGDFRIVLASLGIS
jgi:hypothetical protein